MDNDIRMTSIIFMVIAGLVVLIGEVCKHNAFYKATAIFRVLGALYVTTVLAYGFGNPTDIQTMFGQFPRWLIGVFGLIGGYNAGMFVLELYRPRKYYANYLDVPRQVLYKVGKYGRCQVLSEREAKKAHDTGETVYIHAMARVTYKPQDAKPKVDKEGTGTNTEMFAIRDTQGNTLDIKKGKTHTQEEIKEFVKFIHEHTKRENPN